MVNLILFLLPGTHQRSNFGFTNQPAIDPQQIRVLNNNVAKPSPPIQPEANPLQGTAVASQESAVSKLIDGQCYRVGPFLHTERLSSAKNLLDKIGVLYEVEKRESAKAEVYRVFIGTFNDQTQAREARQQLNENGIFDHFVKRDTDGRYLISLGIYSRETTANASLKRFEDRSLKVRLRPEQTVLPDSYWLGLLARNGESLPFTELQQAEWGEYSAQFGTYDCQS